MKSRYWLGLVVGIFLTVISGISNASIIYMEDQFNATGDGWSNTETTNASDYGLVHGLWGNDNSTLSRVFSLTGNQTEVTINFRYWAISTWDIANGDIAQLKVDNTTEWFSTVAIWSSVTSPWNLYSGTQFPNNNHGRNLTRYQDISITVLTTGMSLDVSFIGILNQPESDESWAVSNINILDNSQIPIPGAIWLFGSGLVGLIGLRRKKN